VLVLYWLTLPGLLCFPGLTMENLLIGYLVMAFNQQGHVMPNANILS